MGPVIPARDVCAYRGKNVPAMEGGGNFGPYHPIRVRNLANGLDTIAVLDHGHQAVVGQHEELTALRFHDHGLARTANARIDHDHKYRSGREVRGRTKQKAGAVADRERIDLMREVDDAEVRRDPVHDALAERYRIIDDAEIGHENNSWRWLYRRLLRQRWADDHQQADQRPGKGACQFCCPIEHGPHSSKAPQRLL